MMEKRLHDIGSCLLSQKKRLSPAEHVLTPTMARGKLYLLDWTFVSWQYQAEEACIPPAPWEVVVSYI